MNYTGKEDCLQMVLGRIPTSLKLRRDEGGGSGDRTHESFRTQV